MKKTYWVLLKILLSLFVLLLILQISISLVGDNYVGNLIKERIRTSSDSLYSLQFDDLDIGLYNGSLRLHELKVTTDTTAYPDTVSGHPALLNGTLGDIDIYGIDLWAYLFRNSLSIDDIQIKNSNIDIVSALHEQDTTSNISFSTVDSTVFAVFSNKFKSLSIGHIRMKAGNFVTHKGDAVQDTSMWVEGLDLTLRNIRIDSSTAKLKRLFPTADVECHLTLFGRHVSGDLYSLKVHNLVLSRDERIATADSIQFLPRYPKYDFSRHHGTQIDRITLNIPHVEVNGIDLDQSIYKNHFYAKSGTIDQPRLEVFHDKHMPPPPPHGAAPLPHVTFKQMRTQIKLDSLAIDNGYISYAEQKENLNDPGEISFENISATFSGISNYKEDLTNEHVVHIKTNAKVMGQGDLNVDFSFPMGDNNGQHHISGTLGAMNATAFNDATENIAMVQFTSGILHHLNFSMDANAYGANGYLTADYENFKIKMLKEESREAKGTKRIKSFLANAFMIRGSNHDHPLGKAAIRFERKDPKSIFNLWWKGLLSGLKEQFDTI